MRRILKKGFSKSKPILNEIDQVLAGHYRFTDEELNFIPSTRLRAITRSSTGLSNEILIIHADPGGSIKRISEIVSRWGVPKIQMGE